MECMQRHMAILVRLAPAIDISVSKGIRGENRIQTAEETATENRLAC